MKTYRSIHFLLLSLMLSSLPGCAFRHPVTPEIRSLAPADDPTMVRLNKIAEKSERSARMLTEIQIAQAESNITMRGAKNARIAMTATPTGWGKLISVSFQGPFNKLLYRLATQAGYQFFTQGSWPATLPLVTIEETNKSLKQILDQVIGQLPSSIRVAIYPCTKSFVVDYHTGQLP